MIPKAKDTPEKGYQMKLTDMLHPKRHQDKQERGRLPHQKERQKEPQVSSPKADSKNEAAGENDSNLSARTQPIPETLYNVQFYRNQIPSVPHGATIERILKQWEHNYDLLEKHHGFIQWLFPNLFQSRFNSQAHSIVPAEVDIFLKEPAIYNRYVRAYQMMLGFYGMKLKSKETGEIARSRSPPFEERCSETLLKYFHNHMRITRMLSSLALLGFVRYAIELLKFLKEEIFSSKGWMKELQKHRVYEKEWEGFEKLQIADCRESEFFNQYSGHKRSSLSKPSQTKEKSPDKPKSSL